MAFKITKKTRHYLREFDSWTDFVHFAEKNSDKNGASHLNGDDFANCSFDEAVRLAKFGWQDGVDNITVIAQPIFDAISSRIPKRRVMTDVQGGSVLVGRFLAGAPDCMQKFKQTRQAAFGAGRRMIHVIYNQSTSGAVSTGVMQARGATVAALAGLLEFAGYVVEITLVDAAVGFNYEMDLTWQMRVPLKRAGTLADMSRIAFGLSHPACLRRLAFGVQEGEPHFVSHGAPMEITQWRDKGDIYIGSATFGNLKWDNEAEARMWIVDRLAEQGIELR